MGTERKRGDLSETVCRIRFRAYLMMRIGAMELERTLPSSVWAYFVCIIEEFILWHCGLADGDEK